MYYKPTEMVFCLIEQCAVCLVSHTFSLYIQHMPLRLPGGHTKWKVPSLVTSVFLEKKKAKKSILQGLFDSEEKQGIEQ